MKTFEKILIGLFLIGLTMKFFFLPFAGLVLTLACGMLALLYFMSGLTLFSNISFKDAFKRMFASSNKDTFKFGQNEGLSPIQIFVSKLLAWGLSLLVLGILFKIQHFPNSGIMLILGFGTSLLCMVYYYIFYIQTKEKRYISILSRAVVICIIGFFTIFSPATLIIKKLQYRNHPQYIEAYENFLKDTENVELMRKVTIEHQRVILSEEEFEQYMREQESANQE